MSTFKLKVIAHDKVFYDGEVQTIIIPALDGHYQYLSDHEESVAAISEGELKIVDDKGKDIYGICSAGFLEFDNGSNSCRVFVNTIELPEEIDIRRAQEAKQEAEEELRQKQSIQEYYQSKASLARAMARLRGAEKHGRH